MIFCTFIGNKKRILESIEKELTFRGGSETKNAGEMTSEIAAMLDELMGRGRNEEAGKQSNRGKDFLTHFNWL